MADQVNYKVVEGWEQLPKGFAHRDVAGVAVDQEDRVFLICRGENPVIVYDRQSEGYVRLDRSDLVQSSDTPGESGLPAVFWRGRLYILSAKALEIYGD